MGEIAAIRLDFGLKINWHDICCGQVRRKDVVMDQREIIGKLRDCAKGLLDVARELQRAERVVFIVLILLVCR